MRLNFIQATLFDENDSARTEILIVEWRDIDGGSYFCHSNEVLTGKAKDPNQPIRLLNSQLKKEASGKDISACSPDRVN